MSDYLSKISSETGKNQLEVKKVISPLSEPRKAVLGFSWTGPPDYMKANCRIRVFPETKFTLIYLNKPSEGEGMQKKSQIFVCKVISDHNLNLKGAVLKTEKDTKQMVDTKE